MFATLEISVCDGLCCALQCYVSTLMVQSKKINKLHTLLITYSRVICKAVARRSLTLHLISA